MRHCVLIAIATGTPPAMCLYEYLGLLLFIATLVIIYIPSLIVLGGRAVAKMRGKKAVISHRQQTLENALLAVAAVGAVLMAYGYFIEPYWVEVTHVRLGSPKLANYDRPIRVVQISDLHSDPIDRAETKVARMVAAQKPDIILFTGDCINSRKALPIYRKCVETLGTVAPLFAVYGNHDTRCWADLPIFKAPVVSLNGTSQKVTVRGQDIYLAGVGVDNEGAIPQALSAIPANAYTVFLYHSPDFIREFAQRNIDLVAAGHTHGGQVCLPFYGAIITQSTYGKQFEAGLYKVDNTWMYVNRGIGMEGGIDPRVRFLARPEITVFDLVPASQAGSTKGAALASNVAQASPEPRACFFAKDLKPVLHPAF